MLAINSGDLHRLECHTILNSCVQHEHHHKVNGRMYLKTYIATGYSPVPFSITDGFEEVSVLGSYHGEGSFSGSGLPAVDFSKCKCCGNLLKVADPKMRRAAGKFSS